MSLSHTHTFVMSRPFDLVALDLDGTLLNDDENLPDLNRDILVALHACGVEIAFCTGRSTKGALAALQVFPVDFSFWLVTLNGVYIYDKGTIQSSDRPLLHSNVATSDFAGKLLDFSKEHELMLECQTEDTDRFLLMRTNENREFFTRHETELSYMPIKVIDSCTQLRGQAFAHMHVFSPDSQSVDLICDRLRSQFPTDQAHLIRQVYRNIHWIEIKPPNVCKGAGLAKLCQHLNIDLNRVIAFGDGDNDIEFLQHAGLGVAMLNGQERLKQHANKVTTKSNTDCGVAHELSVAFRDLLTANGFRFDEMPASSMAPIH